MWILSPAHQVFPPNQIVIAARHDGIGSQYPTHYRGPIFLSCCIDGVQLSAVFVRTIAFNPPEGGHGLTWEPHVSLEMDAIRPTLVHSRVPKA